MKWRKQSTEYDEKWRSKNIIQCTQKSFKVPAVVYKYVAWQAVEEEEEGVGRSYQQ